jgi:hypothetical protein
MLVTGVIGAGVAGSTVWRQKQQFRKLVPVIAFCSAWRDAASADPSTP